MVSVVRPGETPRNMLGTRSSVSLSSNLFQDTPTFVPLGDYQLTQKQQSECALILFAQHTRTAEHFVIKMLCEYQDTRYNLNTYAERQRCQLEALLQNRALAQDVCLGLARVRRLDLENMALFIDDFLEYPTREMLDPESEYALIMRQLPAERRVDRLLQEQPIVQKHLQVLATHIASLHKGRTGILSSHEREEWGSSKHIEKKLLHNFGLLDLVLTKDAYRDGEAYSRMANRLTTLKETLYAAFALYQSWGYFDHRMARSCSPKETESPQLQVTKQTHEEMAFPQEFCIKHCHGDLKSPNMWIMEPGQWRTQEAQVLILDTADFNSAYTHIDVLSDVALLVADIQARTGSTELADLFTQSYLHASGQEDRVSAAVLRYYLVEKAIVGAAISLVYDDLSELGLAFLETAERRSQAL